MSGNWSSIDFPELAQRLSDAIEWLRGLEASVEHARLGRYRSAMEDLAAASARGDRIMLRAIFPRVVHDLFEANEIATIHAAFRDGRYDDVVRGRIQAFTSGPERYVEEGASASNRPRNLAFELLVGARLVASGLGLAPIVNPDIVTFVGKQRVILECKRPQSEAKVERNVTDARDQLLEHLKRRPARSSIGIVAVDLTKLTNPEFALLSGMARSEGAAQLSTYLEQYFRERHRIWARVAGRRIVGILLRVSVLAHFSDDKDLTYCQQYLLAGFDTARPTGHLTLVQPAAAALLNRYG